MDSIESKIEAALAALNSGSKKTPRKSKSGRDRSRSSLRSKSTASVVDAPSSAAGTGASADVAPDAASASSRVTPRALGGRSTGVASASFSLEDDGGEGGEGSPGASSPGAAGGGLGGSSDALALTLAMTHQALAPETSAPVASAVTEVANEASVVAPAAVVPEPSLVVHAAPSVPRSSGEVVVLRGRNGSVEGPPPVLQSAEAVPSPGSGLIAALQSRAAIRAAAPSPAPPPPSDAAGAKASSRTSPTYMAPTRSFLAATAPAPPPPPPSAPRGTASARSSRSASAGPLARSSAPSPSTAALGLVRSPSRASQSNDAPAALQRRAPVVPSPRITVMASPRAPAPAPSPAVVATRPRVAAALPSLLTRVPPASMTAGKVARLPASAYTAGLGHSRDWVDVTNTAVLMRLPEPGVTAQLSALRAAIPGPVHARRSLSQPAAQRRMSVSSPLTSPMSGHPIRRSIAVQDDNNAAEAQRARAAGLVVGSRVARRVSSQGLGPAAVSDIIDAAAARLYDRATELRERKAALVAAAIARGGSGAGSTFRPAITRLANVMGAAVPYVTMADMAPGAAAEPLLPAADVATSAADGSVDGAGASPHKAVSVASGAPGALSGGAIVVASRFEALYASASAASRRRAALEASLYGPSNATFSFTPAITRRAQSLTPADRAKTLTRTALAGLPATAPPDGTAAVQAAALAATAAAASPASAAALSARMHAYASVYAAKRSARAMDLQAKQVPGAPSLNARSLVLAAHPRSASAQGRLAQHLPLHERGLGVSLEALAARQAQIELQGCTFSPAINAPSGSRPPSRASSRSAPAPPPVPSTPLSSSRRRAGSVDVGSAARVGPFSSSRLHASQLSSPGGAAAVASGAPRSVGGSVAEGEGVGASPSSMDGEAAHLRLTRFGVERAARLQAARSVAAAREMENATFRPVINAASATGGGDAAPAATRGRSIVARPLTSSTAATATARLYDEAKATESRLEARRAELLAAREAAAAVRMPFSPKLSDTTKALAEVARARRAGSVTPTPGVLAAAVLGARPTASAASSARASPATLPGDSTGSRGGGVWDALYTEARVFSAARARAIAVAVADTPTFTPAVSAASVAMVAARRAAEALAASRPATAEGSGGRDGGVVWDKLLAAAQSDAGLAELAADCALALQQQKRASSDADSGAARELSEELGPMASQELASVARDALRTALPSFTPSAVGRVKAAAALIEASTEAQRGGTIWKSLAGERKDVALLEAIHERLELSQCSFVPNQASPAEKLLAAQLGQSKGRKSVTPSPAGVYSSVVAAVTEEAAAALAANISTSASDLVVRELLSSSVDTAPA